ncbi:MAG: tetratricopeptide repeat protein [Phycisphaeraceae bacterium]
MPSSTPTHAARRLRLVILPLLTAALLATACDGGDGQAEPERLSAAELDQRVGHIGDQFARALDERGSFDEQIAELQRILKAHPEHAPGHRLLGQMLMISDRNEEALDHFEVALAEEPGDLEVHLLAGTLALEMQDLDRAYRHYSEAVGIEPRHGRARLHLAQVHTQRQEYDRARLALLEALRLDDSLHAAYAGLADLYARQGRPSQALDQIDRALERLDDDRDNPRYERHRISYTRKRAQLLRRANEPQAALDALQGLPAEAQMTLTIADDLALTWEMLDEPERAARNYESLLLFRPDDERVAARAARWYIKAARPDEAARQIEALRRINPRAEALPELERALAGLADAG